MATDMSQTQTTGSISEPGEKAMSQTRDDEHFEEREVTYTLLKDDKFYIVENVPARVNVDTVDMMGSEIHAHHINHQNHRRIVFELRF